MKKKQITILKTILRETYEQCFHDYKNIVHTRKNLANWIIYFAKTKKQKGDISRFFYRHLLNNLLPRMVLYLEEKILHQKAQEWVKSYSVYKKGPKKFFAPSQTHP